jgi:hypothetical protein
LGEEGKRPLNGSFSILNDILKVEILRFGNPEIKKVKILTSLGMYCWERKERDH